MKVLIPALSFCLLTAFLQAQSRREVREILKDFEPALFHLNFSGDEGKLSGSDTIPDLPIYSEPVLQMLAFENYPKLPVPASLQKFLKERLPTWPPRDLFYLITRYNYSTRFDSYIIFGKMDTKRVDFADGSIYLINISSGIVLSLAEVASHFHKIDDPTKNSTTVNLSDNKFTRTLTRTNGDVLFHGWYDPKPVVKRFKMSKETAQIK